MSDPIEEFKEKFKEKFKEIYFPNDNNEDKNKTLFAMAVVYREMIDIENRLMNNRTTWFLTFNGFLFAALSIILAYYKDHPGFLIFVSLVFVFCGCIHALWVFRQEVDNGHAALAYTRSRWKAFVNAFYGYKISDLSKDFFVPPIIGLSIDQDDPETIDNVIQERKKTNLWEYKKTPLAYTMASVWCLLFLVIALFNCWRIFNGTDEAEPWNSNILLGTTILIGSLIIACAIYMGICRGYRHFSPPQNDPQDQKSGMSCVVNEQKDQNGVMASHQPRNMDSDQN